MPDRLSTEYIGATEYKKLEDKLKSLNEILDDLGSKLEVMRKLRFDEVDIEAEREAGRFQPDELYVPQHIVDTNIRREQSPYVQYITQSPRAVILEDLDDDSVDLSKLEKDLTKKLRYPGWQLDQFANIDGFQANGYGIQEVVQNQQYPGEVAHEYVQYCDFAFTADSRNIQEAELVARKYYFTRTKLLALTTAEEFPWSAEQVEKVIARDPDTNRPSESLDIKDKSLYPVVKVMYRINGIVYVAWCRPDVCDDWLRGPKKLSLGRMKLVQDPNWQPPVTNPAFTGIPTISPVPQEPPMIPVEMDETEYPYVLFPYLISENDTISELKGRIFLDQDIQEAISSLISSLCTKTRRSAGLYFSRDASDPNEDVLTQRNIFFKSGCLINAKVKEFALEAPDPGMFSAVNTLLSLNQNETSQTNFAVNNRKDSRKTATEVATAASQQATLSTVQVVLFSIGLTQLYTKMANIIKSRVIAGLIKVSDELRAMYARNWSIKPSGDVDVIERQQLINSMMNSWPVIQNTPAAVPFLIDLINLMFPARAAKYIQAIMQAQQQQASAQQQQLNTILQEAKSMADGIVHLSTKPEMFSDVGKIHALPQIQQAAQHIKSRQQALLSNGNQQAN